MRNTFRTRGMLRSFAAIFSLSVFIFAATPAQIVFAQYADGQRCGPNIPAEQCPCPPNVKPADCKAIVGNWPGWKADDGTCTAGPTIGSASSEATLAQHLFVGVSDPGVAKDILANYDIGGIFLISSGSPGRVSNELKTALPSLQSSAKTPLLIATDQEYTSTVNSFSLADGKKASDLATGAPSYDFAKSEGERFGAALAGAGVNMDFAPDVDIQVGSNAIIGSNNRGISSDPSTITGAARAFSTGLASKGVIPVIKHFPGHGNSNGDSHQTLPTTPNISQLEASDLKPFKDLATEPKMAVMVGHLSVPGLTEEGKPASASPKTYEYLRNTTGFTGLAITDELANMAGAGEGVSLGKRIANSLNAGADMALFNVSSVDGFKAAFDEAKTSVTNAGDTNIREQKRRLGLNMPDTNVTASTGTAANSSCCSTGGATTVSLAGNNNTEKILSFLMSNSSYKFSLVQAAGLTGNFFVESGGTSEAGDIPESSMVVGPNPAAVSGAGFYGIAQWGGGRWQGTNSLNQFASDHGGKWDDLQIQLRFLVWELGVGENWEGHSPTETASLEAIKSYQNSTNLEDAGKVAYLFEAAYERCGCTQDKRANAGRNVYAYYSDKGALQGSGSTSSTATQASFNTSAVSCNGAGAAAGDFVFYTQWDPSSAWADHPFWGGNIAQNGCGPTGAAEVIATWVDKKVTPIEVADFITSIGAEGQGSRLPEVYAHFGLTAKPIGGKEDIIAGLKAGGMVQISASGSSPFTSAGHFIIIRGITADGQVLLGDPNSPAPGAMPGHERADYNSRPWDLDTIFAAMDSSGVHSLNLVTKDKPV